MECRDTLQSLPWKIHMAYKEDWDDAMNLAWKTFLQFDAPEYSREGIRNFNDFVTDNMLYRMFLSGAYQMIVAESTKQMVGMITLRDNSHISLLFVDEKYHKQGIGRQLLTALQEYLSTELDQHFMTVNSSPYAVEFYHKYGFQDLDHEICRDGIRYTPMKIQF
ncbi:MAG: GNAT family N-acetyltransferase [Lachnospiraceae bacterium]|nr:GNAT family N-acetyltransferase [Lachnospiraceae bacterium]